jgi:BolA protein
MIEVIKEKIIKELAPEFLEVVNNSHLHKGHSGHDGSGNTHFKIIIKSSNLSHLGKVEAHRRINKVLDEEFNKGLHALEIKLINNV